MVAAGDASEGEPANGGVAVKGTSVTASAKIVDANSRLAEAARIDSLLN